MVNDTSGLPVGLWLMHYIEATFWHQSSCSSWCNWKVQSACHQTVEQPLGSAMKMLIGLYEILADYELFWPRFILMPSSTLMSSWKTSAVIAAVITFYTKGLPDKSYNNRWYLFKITLKILSILSNLIFFFWSSLLMLQMSESMRKRPNPITLTSICFSLGVKYMRFSNMCTEMLTTSPVGK